MLGRSFAIVRDRWLVLVLFVFGLGWAPVHVVFLTVHSGYQRGSHDLGRFAAQCALWLANSAIWYFSTATVVRAALPAEREASPLPAIMAVIAALPMLFPIWLSDQYDTLLSFWLSWTDVIARIVGRSHARGDLLMAFVWVRLATDIAISLAAAGAVGVLMPVVLAERRGLIGSLARTWRLMAGSRWRFVALFLLYCAVGFAIGFLRTTFQIGRSHGGTEFEVALNWVVGALDAGIDGFWAVIVAGCYLELRVIRDGPPHDQAAEVFA